MFKKKKEIEIKKESKSANNIIIPAKELRGKSLIGEAKKQLDNLEKLMDTLTSMAFIGATEYTCSEYRFPILYKQSLIEAGYKIEKLDHNTGNYYLIKW